MASTDELIELLGELKNNLDSKIDIIRAKNSTLFARGFITNFAMADRLEWEANKADTGDVIVNRQLVLDVVKTSRGIFDSADEIVTLVQGKLIILKDNLMKIQQEHISTKLAIDQQNRQISSLVREKKTLEADNQALLEAIRGSQ